MGVHNIEKITDEDLVSKNVSQREFDLIKKFMKIDPEIFAYKQFVDSSPHTYSIDLSKYENV